MDKINFTNKIWDSPENQRLKELIEEFELNPYVTSRYLSGTYESNMGR